MESRQKPKSEPRRPMGRWVILANLIILALSFALIKPEWAGRLTAVTLFLAFVTVALLIYGFHPNSEFLHHKSKIARCGSERTKRVARWIIRSLVIAGAVRISMGSASSREDGSCTEPSGLSAQKR